MTATSESAPTLEARPGPVSLREVLAEFRVEIEAVDGCDHTGTSRTQKFNGGAGAVLCDACDHIVSYGFQPLDTSDADDTIPDTSPGTLPHAAAGDAPIGPHQQEGPA